MLTPTQERLRTVTIRNRWTGAVVREVPASTLRSADLSDAALSGADLRNADLRGAVLSGAVLSGAVLSGAVLSGAVLSRAVLRSAVLSDAVLSGADLRGAVLSGADLRDAVLSGADLRGAVLSGAVLSGADLSDARLPEFWICPREGALIAYKCVQGHVLRLEVPADAERTCCLTSRQCRASHVRVLSIHGGAGGVLRSDGQGRGVTTEYRLGEIVTADRFDPDIRLACSHGIHFFTTVGEACAFAGIDVPEDLRHLTEHRFGVQEEKGCQAPPT